MVKPKNVNQSGANTDSFHNQVMDNKSQQIGMQLNIPVFNGFRNNKRITASKTVSEKEKLNIEQEKQQLDKQVALEEQNKVNYLHLQNKLDEKQRCVQVSFVTTQAKFTNGKV